jgi:hypothetical protein
LTKPNQWLKHPKCPGTKFAGGGSSCHKKNTGFGAFFRDYLLPIMATFFFVLTAPFFQFFKIFKRIKVKKRMGNIN